METDRPKKLLVEVETKDLEQRIDLVDNRGDKDNTDLAWLIKVDGANATAVHADGNVVDAMAYREIEIRLY